MTVQIIGSIPHDILHLFSLVRASFPWEELLGAVVARVSAMLEGLRRWSCCWLEGQVKLETAAYRIPFLHSGPAVFLIVLMSPRILILVLSLGGVIASWDCCSLQQWRAVSLCIASGSLGHFLQAVPIRTKLLCRGFGQFFLSLACCLLAPVGLVFCTLMLILRILMDLVPQVNLRSILYEICAFLFVLIAFCLAAPGTILGFAMALAIRGLTNVLTIFATRTLICFSLFWIGRKKRTILEIRNYRSALGPHCWLTFAFLSRFLRPLRLDISWQPVRRIKKSSAFKRTVFSGIFRVQRTLKKSKYLDIWGMLRIFPFPPPGMFEMQSERTLLHIVQLSVWSCASSVLKNFPFPCFF